MSDTRLKKDIKPVEREDRAIEDRSVTQNREISDDDRLELYRSQFFQHALPDLPEIPGYHVCWLTTTNPRDSIHMRMRLGYEPVRPADVPGYDSYTMKTGEWAGFIGVNEMLAFKLPLPLYERYMNEAHVYAPHREAQKITSVIDDMNASAQQMGGQITEDEGYQELRQSPRAQRWT